MTIPITKVQFSGREARAVAAVLRSGWVMQGPQVQAFERAVAGYVGTREAVATSSCTSALHLALLALGVGPGDEVIIPSLSFIATANAVVYCGAVPRFADVDPRTYTIDPATVESLIGRRTKAIMPVDQIGLPADYKRVAPLAERHRLSVVADAACALGAVYQGQRVGRLARLSCFSFHPRKIITTGEGGMITTDVPSLAAQLRILRSQGMSKPAAKRQGSGVSAADVFAVLGYNYRMTDLQAAIGLEQLKMLDRLITARRRLAKRYDEALGALRGVLVPAVPPGSVHTYQSYMIRVTPQARADRDDALGALQAQGIGAKAGVTAIHREPLYQRRFGHVSLPGTDTVAREGLILPLYPSMTRAEQDQVIRALTALWQHGTRRGRATARKESAHR